MALTLADLKRRLTVGTVFYCTQNVRGPIDPPAYRRVVIQQTNAVACATGPGPENDERAKLYWLRWPKASEVREAPGGFEIVLPDAQHNLLYLWELPQPSYLGTLFERIGGGEDVDAAAEAEEIAEDLLAAVDAALEDFAPDYKGPTIDKLRAAAARARGRQP